MERLVNDFSIGLFFWVAVIFTILIFLMAKFAWKPILNAINEREEGIQNALNEAEKARKEMQNLQADNERLLKEARAERDTMLKEAREMREKMLEEAKEEAQEEATRMIKKAKEAIEQEKQVAVADLKKQVAGISIQIAEKVVKKELASPNDQEQLVNGLLDEITLN
ncbi:MAG: F0F1 ATP synthase subunit B [Tenacibaculum sp.]|nr:F0F1 ATP synthase subunit B [Tenacibaculum sp.]